MCVERACTCSRTNVRDRGAHRATQTVRARMRLSIYTSTRIQQVRNQIATADKASASISLPPDGTGGGAVSFDHDIDYSRGPSVSRHLSAHTAHTCTLMRSVTPARARTLTCQPFLHTTGVFARERLRVSACVCVCGHNGPAHVHVCAHARAYGHIQPGTHKCFTVCLTVVSTIMTLYRRDRSA